MEENYKILSKTEFRTLLENLQEKYTNNISTVDDEFFDYLVEYYIDKFNEEFNLIGYKPVSNIETLEISMPSLDKIKGKSAENKLALFLKKNTFNDNCYIIEDKFDGVSIQCTFVNGKIKLLTRGDGLIGSNVSQLAPFLNLPTIKGKLIIRGEIVISKQNFEKYVECENAKEKNTKKLEKSRNTVTGIINSISRGEDFDITLASLLDFIVYEVQYYKKLLSEDEQLKLLTKLGFKTAPFVYITELSIPILEDILIERRKVSEYDIDGIVIIFKNSVSEENENKNPNNKIAFKLDTYVKAKVITIEWNISSKDGKIKPTVIIEEVNILGSYVNKLSGKNAKYIIDNKIGKNTELIITLGGDIIPDIISIEKPSKASDMIYPTLNKDEYDWNESGIEFVIKNLEENSDVAISRFKYFITHLDIKDIGIAIIKKLYNNGIDSFYKLFEMKVENIKNIGEDKKIGEKNAIKICNNIKYAIENSTLSEIMAASCIFGSGFCTKKIEQIIIKYPNVLEMVTDEDLLIKIKEIDGFSDITANKFIKNLPIFITWLLEHPQIKIVNKTFVLDNKEGIVFSGFRTVEESYTKLIEKSNYIVKDSLTKDIKFLIVKNKDEVTSKTEKATKYGIQIIEKEEFKKKYLIYGI